MSRYAGRVVFDRDRETVFDYLADPRNRPEWQSSLRRVAAVAGDPGVGQTWTDVTWPGFRPQMRVTAYERATRWSETGTWRFARADLTLDLADDPRGCAVDYSFRIHVLGPVGAVASWASRPAVAADLRRAARLISERRP